MTKKKKRLIIFGAIFGGVAALIIEISIVVCCIQLVFSTSESTLDEPVITYGEFPFKIVYELNGEVLTYEDTYVCKYEGIGWELALGGDVRVFSSYLKSNHKEEIVLMEDVGKKITCDIGGPKYFLGCNSKEVYLEENIPTLVLTYLSGYSGEDYSLEEVTEQYGLRITSWELSEPIDNSWRHHDGSVSDELWE